MHHDEMSSIFVNRNHVVAIKAILSRLGVEGTAFRFQTRKQYSSFKAISSQRHAAQQQANLGTWCPVGNFSGYDNLCCPFKHLGGFTLADVVDKRSYFPSKRHYDCICSIVSCRTSSTLKYICRISVSKTIVQRSRRKP